MIMGTVENPGQVPLALPVLREIPARAIILVRKNHSQDREGPFDSLTGSLLFVVVQAQKERP
jgi:hypothetical protein